VGGFERCGAAGVRSKAASTRATAFAARRLRLAARRPMMLDSSHMVIRADILSDASRLRRPALLALLLRR